MENRFKKKKPLEIQVREAYYCADAFLTCHAPNMLLSYIILLKCSYFSRGRLLFRVIQNEYQSSHLIYFKYLTFLKF